MRLDLDSIRPPDKTLAFNGREWRLPGALPILTVIEILQLDDEYRVADEADDHDAREAVLRRQHELIHEILAERNDRSDVEQLRFSAGELDAVLAFAVQPPGATLAESPEDAVRDALTADEADGDPPTVAASPPPKRRASRSARRSPAASSV